MQADQVFVLVLVLVLEPSRTQPNPTEPNRIEDEDEDENEDENEDDRSLRGLRRSLARKRFVDAGPALYSCLVKTIPQGLLDEAVGKLRAEFAPEAIYLFGSHAWGTPTEDSDLDFFVIVPHSTEQPVERAQRAHGCLSRLPASKDVIVATRAEIDRVKHLRATLSHQVLERGRKLYG